MIICFKISISNFLGLLFGNLIHSLKETLEIILIQKDKGHKIKHLPFPRVSPLFPDLEAFSFTFKASILEEVAGVIASVVTGLIAEVAEFAEVTGVAGVACVFRCSPSLFISGNTDPQYPHQCNDSISGSNSVNGAATESKE